MTLKGDAKFKWKLTCGFKNDKGFVYFSCEQLKVWKFAFDGFVSTKGSKDLDEKVQKSYLSWHWRVKQSLKKNWLFVSKMTCTSWVNCNVSSGKSENLHFHVLLLSLAYKDSAKKLQKSYLSWHWRVIQTLKKNYFFVWKMTSEIWWILTRAVENLKIGTLMGYVWAKIIQMSCVVKNNLWF